MDGKQAPPAPEKLSDERAERALTDLFADLTEDELADAKEAVLECVQSRGWEVLRDALGRHADSILETLAARGQGRPLETAADYEARLGEVRGIRSIESVIDGLILRGEEAENA